MNMHAKILAATREEIRREFVQWHLTLKAMFNQVVKNKALVVSFAFHFCKILTRSQIKCDGAETGTEPEISELAKLLSCYVIKIIEGGHECCCTDCQSNIMKTVHDQAIEEVKKQEIVEIEEATKQKLILDYQ